MKAIVKILLFVSFTGSCLSYALNYNELEVENDLLGNLDLSAISCMKKDLCMVASDETNALQVVSVENNIVKLINTISLGKFKKENDLEGLTHDGTYFYAVGSHALSRKKNKYQPSRYKIFRILLDDEGSLIQLKVKSLESLLSKSKLSNYLKKSTKRNGINIEGLASDRGLLYLGFRSPVLNGKAQILSFSTKNFWDNDDHLSSLLTIDVGQSRGIRSFEIRNGEFFIVAGPSESIETETLSYKLCINKLGTDIVNCEKVPFDSFKVEGFEILSDNSRLFFYDSQLNGSPVLQN